MMQRTQTALFESVARLLASVPSFPVPDRVVVEKLRSGSEGDFVIYIIRTCCAAVLLWFAIGEAAAQTATISSLYSSKNPSTFGDPVAFSVFVERGTTGTVQFMDGPNNLGEPVAVRDWTPHLAPLNSTRGYSVRIVAGYTFDNGGLQWRRADCPGNGDIDSGRPCSGATYYGADAIVLANGVAGAAHLPAGSRHRASPCADCARKDNAQMIGVAANRQRRQMARARVGTVR